MPIEERTEERITARIAVRLKELTEARDKFIAEANTQVAGFNAAIGELTQLIAPENPAPAAE